MATEGTLNTEAVQDNGFDFLYKGPKGPKIGRRHIQILLTAFGTGIIFSTKTMISLLLLAITSQQSSNKNIPYYPSIGVNSGMVMSSILWTSMFFQLFSGHVGKEYGSKWLILATASLNAVAFCMIPTAASIGGTTGIIVCRLIQGVAQGSYTPLTACIGGAWIPVEERSRMGYIGTIGITGSIIVATLVTGIIAESPIGWPGAIYIFGALNGCWCILWALFGYNNPDVHPSITVEEKMYIKTSLQQETLTKIPTPWVKIFTSIGVWGIILSQIGSNFIVTMLSTENSQFVSLGLKFDISENALASGLPTLLSIACGVVMAFLSDYLITHKILRIVNARRCFQMIGVTGAGLSLVLSTFVPKEHHYWVIPLLCLESFFTMACMVGGSDISGYDLSPMFASVIYGVSGTLSDAVGLFAPLIVDWVVYDKSNSSQWTLVFGIAAIIGITPSIFFVLVASDKRQEWGDYHAPPENIRRLSISSITHAVVKE
ncbi:sodium-dependent phosphate transport protein 1-like [Rhynchophorus ferrugineus]|uniref:sodium-dependent phosphate transport protein 1-like n=1 Tax=Rhynchophorus ferrugineus TaxID=354439 RepID=UPI003FCE85F8